MQYACFAHEGNTMEWTIEIVFFISMCKMFLTDYKVEGSDQPVKSLPKIFSRYLEKGLVRDMIPFFPITLLMRDYHKDIKLFYLIKLCRFPKGMNILNMQEWLKSIKNRK
jgi:hypothetical protein